MNAVIYCRVSSDRQAKEGGGLQSQEQRCRSYAESRGYSVAAVFGDDGVSGALLKRPGIGRLLAFLKAQPGPTAVVIDDISRIARDVKTHLELRTAIAAVGGILESPSMRFEESAAGEFVELVLAASAQFGRKGNREQVLNRQKARLQLGYWTFWAPLGYVYQAHPVHKKIIVPTMAARKILAPALEAFADGRLESQRDLARHLAAKGFFAATRRRESSRRESLKALEMRTGRLLEMLPLYAGFVEYPEWGVERVVGQHEGIISPATVERIKARLAGRIRPWGLSQPARSDAREDFPLRHFVRCPGCGRPFTGCLAKGKYPRYFCYAQGQCSRYGHSISARVIEPAFEQLLRDLEPKEELFEAMHELSLNAWENRLSLGSAERRRFESALEEKAAEIEVVVRRLARTLDDEVAMELERMLKALKAEKAASEAELQRRLHAPGNYAEAFERVSTLLRRPHHYWKNGSLNEKKTVHRLVFTVPPAFDRNTGFSTYELTLPYLISTTYGPDPSRLVEVQGDTWHLVADAILDLERGVSWQEEGGGPL